MLDFAKQYFKEKWIMIVLFLVVPFVFMFSSGPIKMISTILLVAGYFLLLYLGINDDLEREYKNRGLYDGFIKNNERTKKV